MINSKLYRKEKNLQVCFTKQINVGFCHQELNVIKLLKNSFGGKQEDL